MKYRSTRDGYGQALLELGKKRNDVVVLDADLSGSTRTEFFAKAYPERFFNVGVAEQNLIGMAAGLSLSGHVVFASSFAMFLTGRAWEIIRNSVAYPQLNVKLVASHAGITVGEDGASHQSLEDISIMRSIPNMKVMVPSDYSEVRQMITCAANTPGPHYIRLGRSKSPVLEHKRDYSFCEGKGELRRDGNDITIIACGLMVNEADQAAEALAKENISAAVINMSSIKPIDKDLIVRYAEKTGRILTVEEHNVIGGLGSAVSEVVAEYYPVKVKRLGIQDKFGTSGDAEELLDFFHLRSADIADSAKKML